MAARSSARKTARPDAPAGVAPEETAEAMQQPSDAVLAPSTAMLALKGSPRSLVGAVPLANSSSERMILRSAVLHVAGHDPVVIPMAVALRPGTTTDAPLRVDLGPAWPAGEVVGEIEVGGTRVPVSLLVEPTIVLAVSPDEVLGIEGRSSVGLSVHNAGNVALPLAARTRGWLRAHDEEHVDDAASGARAGEPGGERGDGAGTHAGAQVECLLAGPVLLEPGDTRRLELQIVVPSGLDPTRRFRAIVPVGPADLIVTVLPTDPGHQDSPTTT